MNPFKLTEELEAKAWDSGWRSGLLVSSIVWGIIVVVLVYNTMSSI